MEWGINLLQNLKNKFGFVKKLKSSLFFRLSILIIVFTFGLIFALAWGFWFSFERQDSILDAHEAYFYNEMVQSWGTPPDTVKVKKDIENLHLNCVIYYIENDYSRFEANNNSPKYWSSSLEFPQDVFYYVQGAEDFIKHNIEIPLDVQFGLINNIPSTAVENGDFVFYMSYDVQEEVTPTNTSNYMLATILTIIFIISLNFFIRRYLFPLKLIKNRLVSLEDGDLNSTIPILGEDELARLSLGINKMIKEINSLINKKHELLLDVSHELRSPLARMQLLLEMIPNHVNKDKLINEVLLLEGMISNLLLSDKLSVPYKNLNLSNIKLTTLIDKVLDMFPEERNNIEIINLNQNIILNIDELKFILAIRNLIDNAIKYRSTNNKILLEIFTNNNSINFSVTDYGIGIKKENLKIIINPFIRVDNNVNVNGFGIGLTITNKIIKAHKGRLIIKSEINEGSTFTLELPLKKKG